METGQDKGRASETGQDKGRARCPEPRPDLRPNTLDKNVFVAKMTGYIS